MSPEKNKESSPGSAFAPRIQTGTILGDRFEIRSELGSGSVGTCYAAYDRNREQEVCLKVIHPALLKDPNAEAAFLSAAKIACDLRYPGIVNVYDIHREGDLFFISMELLRGKTLRTEMEERKKSGGRFSLEEARVLAEEIGSALTYAHQFTIHRAIKPENIWITNNGAIKVMDFGFAQGLSRRRATMTTIASATAYYLPPEVADEEVELDSRGDQYSLAAVLYEVLTGEPLVGIPKDASDAFPDIPDAAVAAFRKGLAPDPKDRYDSIQAFCDALAAGLRPNVFKRNRRLVKAAVALLSMAVIGSVTMVTDNGAGRWLRERWAAMRGPDWESQAEAARKSSKNSERLLEAERKSLFSQTDQLLTQLDSRKEETAVNFPTNRFVGALDTYSATSDWIQLRPRLLRGYYGMVLTNLVLPEIENETLDLKLAKPAVDLLKHQTRLLRLWRILAFRVFAPEETREARRKMDLGDALVAGAKYREAKLEFEGAGVLFGKNLELTQQIKEAVPAFDQAMSAGIEYLALSRMDSIQQPDLVGRNSEQLLHAWTELTAGDVGTALSESKQVLESWSGLLQDLVRRNEDQATTAQKGWLAFFHGREVPLLRHLGRPDQLIEDGKRLAANQEWYAAHEKFYEARHLYEQWSMEIAELPIPPEIAWGNSLGMYFVPVSDKIWISIWETRVMDFDVFAESGYDADHRWRTLELEANFEQGPTHPVVWVKKQTADAFCEWLTHKERDAGRLTNAVYRLPTDLEWSLAVGLPAETGATPRERSGGIPDLFPWGSSTFPPSDGQPLQGNYDSFVENRVPISVSHTYTAAVGKCGHQGPFSLYDLGGNVWEWCSDKYDENAKTDAHQGWTIRGGSCFTESRERMESSFRGNRDDWSSEVGFRVILEFR